ncbi:MAG: response regulator [Lachnospiraceae bacterium]|nr:response regulator [Lachnospiraceae bacterium]
MKTDEIISAESRFLAYFLHDIRMPVTGIIGMADIALENIGNREKLEDCLIKIKSSSGYLLSIADNVLDVVQYNNNCQHKISKPFDIEDFINGCTSLFAGLLYNRDINFTTCFSGLPVTNVYGDELHLKQILINLFENSVKYTHDGGEIKFEVEEVRYDNNTVTYCFIISDTGIGMSEEFISEIFNPFTQEHADSTARYSGNGLGMAITKQFADMIGGDIKINSKKGEGTTTKVMVTFDIDNSFKKKETNSLKASFDGRNILVVDDSDINAEVICGLLQQRGACTTMALNGKSAVEIFMDSELNFYDAILMDVTMPVMNGLEATKCIRSLDREDASDTLVFAMTGNIFKDDIAKCREAGMDGHLIKPVNLDEFMEKMLEYNNNKKCK